MLNIAYTLLVISGFMIVFLIVFRQNPHQVVVHKRLTGREEVLTIDQLIGYVKEAINDMTRTNLYDLGLSEEGFQRRLNKRSELKKALKNCTYGSIDDKEFVKDYIKDYLKQKVITPENVNKIIAFDRHHFLNVQDKFDILLHHYKKTYQYNGLGQLIEEHHLEDIKYLIEDGQVGSYLITKDEIEEIYSQSAIQLSFEDKVEIITQRVYQHYKGFGVVDEIRDMNIDGLSGGVSGVVDIGMTPQNFTHLANQLSTSTPNHYDSVWIFYKGKSIHLSFLSFESDKELRRICQNIYRYNKAGQLSENIGFKINEMKDGSRVVVVRPSFAESWAFFVRKFHIANVTLEELIQDQGCEIAIDLMKYLVKGARITSITGSQGSGKTTLLMALCKHIYGTLTLRVQEMAFELHLRKVYPMRNILTFKETPTISGQAGLDVQKKTDGAVNILGEVATDEVAVWMLQMAQVASLFTLFTHHAKTVKDLTLSLRNSLLKCDVFRNEKVAEEQVVTVLDFDVHMEKDEQGKRYISRISEIIQLDQTVPYPETYKEANQLDQRMETFMDTMTEYFRRTTDRQLYTVHNIIEFCEGRYVAKEPISQSTQREMLRLMNPEDRKAFRVFLQQHWGHNDEVIQN